MSVSVNRAICLHAQADDLKFLNPVRNRLGKLLGRSFSEFIFGDQNSQAHARLALEKAEGSFVVLFAHGGRNYLRGGEYIHRISREIVEPRKFLTADDAQVFNGKVVFCLSCDSNGFAKASLDAGAKAFVGFDDIPFNRYDAAGNPFSDHVFQHHAQQLIARAIKATLERFVTGKATLQEATAFSRLWICQDVARFVREMTAFKPRREVAALLLRVKDGIKYYGIPDVMFVK